jgi:hypothetical protein
LPSKNANPISDAIRIVVDEYRTLVKEHPSRPPSSVGADGGREGLAAVMKRLGMGPNRKFE